MKTSTNRTEPAKTSLACALVLACCCVSMAVWSLEAASPAGSAAKRDATRCVTQADVDACNDAIRRNPSDPALLVALADGLVRAKRAADAIRYYRRAESLAPHMPGLAAKLSAAEKRLASERSTVAARRVVQPASHAPAGRYSNAAPETQSH